MSTKKRIVRRSTTDTDTVINKGFHPDLQILRLEEAVSKLRRLYDNEKAKNEELVLEIDELRTTVGHQQRVNHVDRVRREQQLISKLELNLSTVRGQLGQLKAAHSKLKAEHRELDSQKQQIAKAYASMKEDYIGMRDELSRGQLRLDAALARMEAMALEAQELADRYHLEKSAWSAEVVGLRQYIESDQKMREVIYNRNMQREIDAARGGEGVQTTGIKEKLEIHKWKSGLKDGARIVTLEQAMERIKEVMGVDDLDTATRMFVENTNQTKDQMINNITQLNEKLANAEKENESLRKNIEDLRSNNLILFSGKSDSKKVRKLESQLHKSEMGRTAATQELNETRRVFADVRNAIERLCERTHAVSRSDEAQFHKEGVTQKTAMTFLGLLEERISDLLKIPGAQTLLLTTVGAPLPMSVLNPQVSAPTEPAAAQKNSMAVTETGLLDVRALEAQRRLRYRDAGIGAGASPSPIPTSGVSPANVRVVRDFIDEAMASEDESESSDSEGSLSSASSNGYVLSREELKSQSMMSIKDKRERRKHGPGSGGGGNAFASPASLRENMLKARASSRPSSSLRPSSSMRPMSGRESVSLSAASTSADAVAQ